MHNMRVMQDPVFRESMSEPRHSSKEKPNAAWSWSVRQWDPAFSGKNYVTRRDRRDYLRSWGYVMWDLSRLEQLKIMECEAHDLKAHDPNAVREPFLFDLPKRGLMSGTISS